MPEKMKRIKRIISSFRTKVTITLVLALFFVMTLSNLLIYEFSLKAQFQQLRTRLMMVAQTAALMIDGDLLLQVPLNRQGVNSEGYKTIAGQLKKIKDANGTLRYIYTMIKTPQNGILQFVVDPEPAGRGGRKNSPTSYPGDKYSAWRFPALLKAFDGPSGDEKLEVDEWGVTLSGYAPIKDRNGRVVAVLGMDMDAKDVYLAQRQVHQRALFVLFIGVLVSLGLGFLISTRLTERIERLARATRRIAADDLQYRVKVSGHDEITELAESFNKMATSLAEARQKLRNYFYRVVQSLVRILEAKDVYTQGHSERVAEYAEKIALAMRIPFEKAEMVKKAGELHDIGKLVIHEAILNKKEKLTDEEWAIIRAHPVVGEDILKPVLVDKELLSMVRSHHERYDGKGYPDRLKGSEAHLFAQIITVADAYDAMTSERAYRPAMSCEQAVEELKKHSGSQFNVKIVETFLKVIEEEKKKD